MANLNSLTNAVEFAIGILTPSSLIQYINLNGPSLVGGIIRLAKKDLSPASLVNITFQPLTDLINEIWFWIVYNIFSPIIMVLGMIFFIAFQLLLIWLTYKVWKEVVLRVIQVSQIAVRNAQVQKAISKVKEIVN